MSERVTLDCLEEQTFRDEVARLGKLFHEESGRPGVFNAEYVLRVIKGLLLSGYGAMFVIRNDEGTLLGTVCGVLAPDIFTGDALVSELFWFVDPAHRGSAGPRLFRALVEWKESLNVRCMMMAHLHFGQSDDSGIEAFYERHGFKKLETSYVRDS